MEKCGAVKFLLLLIYFVNVLHVRDTTGRLTVRMICLVCSVDVEMTSFFPRIFPPASRVFAACLIKFHLICCFSSCRSVSIHVSDSNGLIYAISL